MARRVAAPAYSPSAYSPMPTNAHYDTLDLDIDSTDPYGLGSPQRQAALSPPPHRAYYVPSPSPSPVRPPPHHYYSARSPSPPSNRYNLPSRSHTPYGDPTGYAEAAEDLAAVYAPRYDTPAPPTFAYDEKSEYSSATPAPDRLAHLARRPTGAKASRATSHSGQDVESDEDEELADGLRNIHIGPAPEKVQRRNQTTKRVLLTSGNVVLDCPVPTRLRGFLPRKDAEEHVFMRYSAVTCDPDDFAKCNFTLRPVMYGRDTELLIGITMFNEDEVLFCRTLHHVMKNISHLCSRVKSQTWGTDGWKKIVVCIISDGRKNISPRVLDTLAALGVYQEGVAKNAVRHEGEEKIVEAHLYEFTTQLSVDPKLQFKGLEKGIVPTQILFCLKEKNAKKLNSHRWLFNAFASMLEPNIVILLDVGTKPGPKSLYHLWKTFDLNSNVGGACGEICAMKGRLGLSLLNPLVGAQNFEYKMSNILDKPTESLFGYISVLPGAFSAYRYVALQNDNLKRGPLASYFKGETLAGYEADVYTSNMYLAEDRILCWELVAKRGSHWVLKYVPSAVGETDVPDTVPEWISQRRRWLNGSCGRARSSGERKFIWRHSFFAAIYSLTHVLQIVSTDHSFWRKLALFVESFYNLLQLAFAWFGMGNYYIFFMVLTCGLEDPAFNLGNIRVANVFMQGLYCGTLVSCFIFALGNRPQGSKWKYSCLIASFALLTTYMMGAAVYCVIHAISDGAESAIFVQLVISMLATYGCWVAASLIAADPWHLVTSMAQYLLLAPVFVNLLNTYSFCNLHDFSWGTKQLDKAGTDLGVVIVGEKNAVDIVLPSAQSDVDLAYDDALHNLKTRPKIIPAQKTASQRDTDKQDYYRNVRTNVVLLWVMTNGILAASITSGDLANSFASGEGSMKVKIYMLVVLSFIAFMSAFRFLASTAYRIIRIFTG